MATKTDELFFQMLASPASPGLARTFTEQRLRKWGCFSIVENALLVVSELVTNAVAETPHKEIGFQLSRDAQGVTIAVWDSSPRIPAEPEPLPELDLEDLDTSEDAFDDNGGRGLLIVSSLSHAHGHTLDPVQGKWIWARLSL